MKLSPTSVIADLCWYDIQTRIKNVELGSFVIMPNHMHGILILNGFGKSEKLVGLVGSGGLGGSGEPPGTPPPDSPNEKFSRISPKPGSVSTIARSYKSAVTKHANRLNFDFGWQERFHDHVIRNQTEYELISNYIETNPAKWKEDQFFGYGGSGR